MADIADNAQDHIEREAAGLVARSRKPEVHADGHCVNCGDRVIAGVYCDETCRDDHEGRLRIEGRTGRRLL